MAEQEQKKETFNVKAIQKQILDENEQKKSLATEMMGPDAAKVVEDLKAMGIQPYAVLVGEDWYIYRTMSRFEYKNHLIEQAKQATAILDQGEDQNASKILINLRNEDQLVAKCCIYPKLNELNIKDVPAGTIETLHNSIMMSSGFGNEPMPIKL